MKKKDLLMMMSLSAIPAVAPAVASADMQALSQNPAAAANKVSVASGNSGIFTLEVGTIPVTERSKLGDQRLRTLEEEFAARLGLNMFGAGGESAVPEQYAMRPICCSKTIDCEIMPGHCVYDTDDSF